jgi:phosphohistidine phosphatase
MRHGQAKTPADGGESELTTNGRAIIAHQAERLADLLKQQAVTLQQVYHSGKKRAEQTAAITIAHVAPQLESIIEPGLSPNADPNMLSLDLNGRPGPILLVSHLPFIPALMARLLGKALRHTSDAIAPGTVIALERKDSGWQISSILSP